MSHNLKKGIKLKTLLIKKGKIVLFLNNLTASAKGCAIPPKEGLLGPSRSWE
jgi:hypothetical protein